jgi:hypothetical protein
MSAPSKVSSIIGWVLSVLVAALLTFSAYMKFNFNPEMLAEWEKTYPASAAPIIGAAELACALLFLIPPTSVFGGLLMLAYLGGAVATHVKAQDGMWFSPIVVGVVAWIGLCLREPRLWKLVPFRSAPPAESPVDAQGSHA